MTGKNNPEGFGLVNPDLLFGPDVDDSLTDVNSALIMGTDTPIRTSRPISADTRSTDIMTLDRYLSERRRLVEETAFEARN